MPQPEQTPRPVTPGDPLTASTWNQLRDAVSRLSSFDGQQGAIVNGAGVFVKKSPVNKGIFRLTAALTRLTTATAKLQMWDGTGNTFVDTPDDPYTLSGKLWRGYGVPGALVEAEFHVPSGLWMARGRGETKVWATLTSPLASGGTAGAALASGVGITVHEDYGVSFTLGLVKIGAFWDEAKQWWIVDTATCNP